MAKPWSVPPLWQGRTVVIAASGPSLDAAQLERVRGAAPLITVNDAWLLAPWADWLHGCDWKWWNWHVQRLTDARFAGIRTTLGETVPDAWCPHWLKQSGTDGFDPDPARVRTGRNGLYQAIHCAIHAAAARIVLLGADMKKAPDGRSHFFGEHPDGGACDYATVMLPSFPTLLPALAERRIEILNCTPGSALTCFPMARLEDALP